ncbi:ExeM/NucH family extracellular endonuclease [Alloalcanivorax profundimaris]|uniref:ExeM/NucH family extracellular endonuclease n=1 Tax=Alloalcanivorax profundimaris TaxID=2735259 RepID=UPI00188950F0|nr:ExeM/NucH family extracellular endonuclease [Alloalcanivorax profundimaris]MBF1803227.1 ExeM/NucH family extracellular endonuclease [Alloalcanivorax profundimaris]
MRITIMALAGLGLASAAQANILISEYVEGGGYNKAIELHNAGEVSESLDGYTLALYSNGGTEPGATLALDGRELAAGEVLVIASNQAGGELAGLADLSSAAINHNGDDAYVLRDANGVVDSFGRVGEDPGDAWTGGGLSTRDRTLRRKDNINAGDTVIDDAFDPSAQWQGYTVDTLDGLGAPGAGSVEGGGEPVPLGACGEPVTRVAAIQGDGDASPLTGEGHVIEAVVTAVYPAFDGFYVMETEAHRDNDPATSEGLFVYQPEADVSAGDRVRVSGTVDEYYGLTQISADDRAVCEQGLTVSPVALTLPFDDPADREALEGMLVSVEQPLTVSDNYELARYGSMTLSNGRLFNPTNVAEPGAAARAVKDANEHNQVLLDDASNEQNPATVIYPAGGLAADNTVRAGYRTRPFQAVFTYGFEEWRLQPVGEVAFDIAANPRAPAPSRAAGSDLRVAAFNVLNYFNGDGQGGGFPTERGARDAEELTRQQTKLVAALKDIDADVVGLMEVENDGYGPDSALARLTAALGPAWRYVDPGQDRLGDDAIAVGLIYRGDAVAEAGTAATTAAGAFGNDTNRQPLAQTFRPLNGGEAVTVVVNHFKSKGSCPDDGANAEQGDLQGCWNAERVAAAEQLLSWLESDPTGADEGNRLITGDLNSYAMEDPITTLRDAGLVDLIQRFQGENAYSYTYMGEAGYLDHALASEALNGKVLAAHEWHANADEPVAFSYGLPDYQSDDQHRLYYAADAWRASDHDPVIVDLALSGDAGGEPDPGDDTGDGDDSDGGGLGYGLLLMLAGLLRRRH